MEVIEPCAFPLDDRSMKRAALDYGPLAHLIRRANWEEFLAAPERKEGRLVLFTTKSAIRLHAFEFSAGDTLLYGRESAGAPEAVHAAADARLFIPIRAETRSMNLVTACAVGLSEALRQTNGFPGSA